MMSPEMATDVGGGLERLKQIATEWILSDRMWYFDRVKYPKYLSEQLDSLEKDGREFRNHHLSPLHPKPSDPSLEHRWLWTLSKRKWRMLHSMTLFRHARHISTLWADACFVCPCRFNVTGEDNDTIRSSHALVWLTELRMLGAVRIKPGGFVWFHRDVRQFLRLYLQSRAFYELFYERWKERWKKSWGERDGCYESDERRGPLSRRARTHFWIADWYIRAYRATADPHPMMEALHHFHQCYLYSPFVEPSPQNTAQDPNIRRVELAYLAVNRLARILNNYRDKLVYWLNEPENELLFRDPLFKDDRDDPVWLLTPKDDSEESRNVIMGLRERISDLKKRANAQVRDVYLGVQRRVGDPVAVDSEENAEDRAAAPAVPPPGRTDEVSPSIRRALSLREYRSAVGQILERLDSGKLIPEGGGDAWKRVLAKEPKDVAEVFRKWRAGVDGWLTRGGIGGGDLNHARVMRLLHHLCYAGIMVGKLKRWVMELQGGSLRRDKGASAKWEFQKWFIMSCMASHFIKRIGWAVPPEYETFQTEQYIASQTMYGLALAHLDRFQEAARHLDNAQAFLAHSVFRGDNREWAIIELRRGELQLLRVEWLDEHWNNEGSARLRRRTAHLNDAFFHLDRAEGFLAGASRSAWWWGRLYSLRLRLLHRCLMKDKGGDLLLMRGMDKADELNGLLRKGMMLRPLDPVRSIRLLVYYSSAWQEGKLRGKVSSQDEAKQAYSLVEPIADRARALQKAGNEERRSDLAEEFHDTRRGTPFSTDPDVIGYVIGGWNRIEEIRK